jgi:pimeloyl-ACP methyl ester carboxylesterase
MGRLAVILFSIAIGQNSAPGIVIESAKLPITGGHLSYDTAGSGQTVVLLHGAFMDRRSWDAQMAPFAKQFRVVRYDIRPFGESSAPEEAYNVPDDLLRLLDHLKVERAHLVGHSFGGGVALDFALQHPERVVALVLAAAPPNGFVPPQDELKHITAIFAAVKNGDEAIVKAWVAHPMWSVARTRPAVLKELEAITRRNLAPFRMPFAPYVQMKPAAITRLGEVRAPTLVIFGDRDMPSIKQSGQLVAKEIRGAVLKVIPGADHALPLGWSDEFNAAVLEFLSTATR